MLSTLEAVDELSMPVDVNDMSCFSTFEAVDDEFCFSNRVTASLFVSLAIPP